MKSMITKNVLVAALATASIAFSPVAAQDMEVADTEATAQDEGTELTDAPAEAVPSCELHVFPTLEGQAMTTSMLSGFGIIGAVADAAANKDRNVSETARRLGMHRRTLQRILAKRSPR